PSTRAVLVLPAGENPHRSDLAAAGARQCDRETDRTARATLAPARLPSMQPRLASRHATRLSRSGRADRARCLPMQRECAASPRAHGNVPPEPRIAVLLRCEATPAR